MANDPNSTGNSPGDEELSVSNNPMVELGQSGLRRTSGYIDEEFLPALKGRKAIQVFREMRENDPIIGALLFAMDRLIRQIEWRVEPASQSKEDKEAAEFLEQCMEDMSHTWDDFMSEVLTMLAYGWSWHEIVYKKRVGPWEKDASTRSKYSDGKIGWRKMPIRSQETWLRWVFDDTGGVKAMVQLAPPKYETVPIPIEKSLLFRTTTIKNNPEGRSMLRNAYRPWWTKKRLEEFEAIGVERDLAGLPVAKIPARFLGEKATQSEKAMVDAYKRMVKSVRRDEQEGLVLPQEYDQDTKQPMYEFELLSSAGGRQFDTNEIIKRYEERMLMSVLADFILVGHESTGSYALHTDKTGMFRASINSLAQSIADTINRHAVNRLFAVNGWKPNELPKIVPGDIDPPDLNELSTFMGQLASAGVQWFPDPELEKFLRSAARLPELDEEAEQVKEQEAKQANILRLAQQQMEGIQLKQQVDQGMQQTVQGEMGVEEKQMGLEHQRQQLSGEADEAEQARTEAQAQQSLAQSDAQSQQSLTQSELLHQQKLRHSEEGHKLTMKQKLDQAKLAQKKAPKSKDKK
jgi:hypothetical protein